MLGYIPKWVDQLLTDEEAKETGEGNSDKNAAAEEHSDEETAHSDNATAEGHSDKETVAVETEDLPMRRYPVTRRRPPPNRYGFDRDD